MTDDDKQLTHLGNAGEARMVDVSGKDVTERIAVAEGHVVMSVETLDKVLAGDSKKGDVMGAARIAGQPVKGVAAELARTARRKLQRLDQARSLADLAAFPGNRLERPRGDRSGQHSIRVNDQYRVCFRWEGGDAHDVEIVDYH